MTYIALILLSFLAGAAFAGLCFRVPRTGASRTPSYFDTSAAAQALGAVARVFEPDDQRYVALTGANQRSRFRRQRRHAMRLFLRQTRLEFHAIMRDASAAAKHETPEYGAQLAALSLKFNRLYWALWMRAQFSCLLFRPIPRAKLIELVGCSRGLPAGLALSRHPAGA